MDRQEANKIIAELHKLNRLMESVNESLVVMAQSAREANERARAIVIPS